MVLFFQELRSNETIKKFKHYAWTVYQENNHRKKVLQICPVKISVRGGEGNGHGRVRFRPEMLTNWTQAGVKLPRAHTCTQCEIVHVLLSL